MACQCPSNDVKLLDRGIQSTRNILVAPGNPEQERPAVDWNGALMMGFNRAHQMPPGLQCSHKHTRSCSREETVPHFTVTGLGP
jgi:hypothetical protein